MAKAEQNGKNLTHNETKTLIDPNTLMTTINTYREQIETDPNAPIALLEILNEWTQNENYDEDDKYDNEDEYAEDDDEYYDEDDHDEE